MFRNTSLFFRREVHAPIPELYLHEVNNSTLSHGEEEWEKP